MPLVPATYPTFERAYLDVLRHLVDEYEYRNAPRGAASRESMGMSFRIENPVERLPYLAARRVNPIFHFAEALWYMGGCNDVAMMRYYAPYQYSVSRDGVTLGGSAYGARIFQPAVEGVSSFDRVMNLLRTEKDSKRGLIPIFEAPELAVENNPDVSCVVAIHLLLREGRLHMVCYMRANDCYRGMVADVFSFTLIQEYAAVLLGAEMGTYTHHIGSAHIGDRDFDRVQQVLAEADGSPHREVPRWAMRRMPTETTPEILASVQQHETALRTNTGQYRPQEIAALALPVYWQQVLLLFEVQRQLAHCHTDPVDAEVLSALDPGLRWLVAQRWPTRMPGPFLEEAQ
ncbi:thymidylate synthase [Streptomyces smyrnaeus]|uniref:thymidylate synthase n=1 Tax=Streptomyces smyrnaeus TaxID=1387713 RepID=UPI0033AC8AA1